MNFEYQCIDCNQLQKGPFSLLHTCKKKRDPEWYEDHQKGCLFGQPEMDDYCKDCECDEGWFD